MPVKIISARWTPEEAASLRQAAAALDLAVSALVATAGVTTAHRFGFFADSTETTFRHRGPWPDKPIRHDESASKRFTVCLNAVDYELVMRVVAKLTELDPDLNPPLFLTGAALRFIANKQKSQPDNKALQAVHIPEQYLNT